MTLVGANLIKVLLPSAREFLHSTAKEGGMGHRVFTRPLSGSNGEIEVALDNILTKLEDDSKYVEYWTRQEWRSIEAHADVDELLAKKEDAFADAGFRYPRNGHVLYLQVGTEVRGPTCIFPDRVSGGDLVRPDEKSVDLVTVPAVPGRLLRFEGSYLHAVPRPTDLWFLKFVKGGAEYTPEEEWGRSVILFNTWDENPPLDVPLDDTVASDGSVSEKTLITERTQWTRAFTLGDNDDVCAEHSGSQERLHAKIWLLGNERRRDFRMRTLKLAAPESTRQALQEESLVSRLTLEQ
jgi:hypothetical protein